MKKDPHRHRAPGLRGNRFVSRALVLFLLVVCSSTSWGWAVRTHIYAANMAIVPILAGQNVVIVNGEAYAVDPRVAEAIRNYPNHYRAGVMGPDGFPDTYVGQSAIHPDTRFDNGTLGTPETGAGHSFTYEWLRHVYEAGWQYYNDNGGNAKGQKALAFSYGFLTHAAGDMWAHSFVNSFARGVAPSPKDVPNLGILVRHLVMESYMAKHTPDTDVDLPTDDAELADFVWWALIAGGKDGGFVDSANNDPSTLGRGAIFGFFFDLRWAVEDRRAALESLGPLNPVYLLTLPLQAYMDAWVEDIDNGLYAWPLLAEDVTHALFNDPAMDVEGAKSAVGDFIFDHIISMIGFPDFVAEIMETISDIMSFFGDLIEPLTDAAKDLRNWVIFQATGIDVDEMKALLLDPANHINSNFIGFPPDTSSQIDTFMGITPGSGAEFNPELFLPMKNTIVTSAMVLMTPEALNQMLYNHRVGPIYQAGSLNSDRDNFMLGYIRSLDGHQQWRIGTSITFPNSPAGTKLGGMPIWVDCLARERVFRELYSDWRLDSFPDEGEAAHDLSATPPPGSSLSLLGPSYATGGVTYVGASTQFQVSGLTNHFWDAEEISVTAGLTPPGGTTTAAGSVTLGPIVGADGVYTVQFGANGHCIAGPPHSESTKSRSFTLDQTPPQVTVTPPAEGLVLDVNQTSTFGMTVVDPGSGVKTSGATLDGAPIFDGDVIDAFLLTFGAHTIVGSAEDQIGNAGSVTRTFYVRATIAGLKAALSRGYAQKLITLPPKEDPPQKKLDRAQSALNAGDIKGAKNHLSSLAEQVKKYMGKGVDPAFGNRFVGWINDLINRL